MVILLVIMLLTVWWANAPVYSQAPWKWEPMAVGEAAWNAAFAVVMALVWSAFLLAERGTGAAAGFLSGYVMEWALSIDNLMAISLVFAYFRLPEPYEPKILFAGIWSAVVFRLVFTLIGATLFQVWERPIEIIFSLIVLHTAITMVVREGEEHAEVVDHESRWYVRCLRRWIPITGNVSEPVLFKKVLWNFQRGQAAEWKWVATPLLACLVAVEATDITFSFDSAPVVVAVSRTPLVIYSAMLFAILGLRSMYFLLAAAQRFLVYLPRAVGATLFFISLKLFIHGSLGMDMGPLTLPIVLGLLGWGVVASLREKDRAESQTIG